tara:strand:- start:89 stop:313 length:225 start_codon:yes stop_codon:yes gene_type:complete
MDEQKKNLYKISVQQKEISELYVVIDTLQTNLRSAVSYLNEEERGEIENHSYKWCVDWKAGDEKQWGNNIKQAE